MKKFRNERAVIKVKFAELPRFKRETPQFFEHIVPVFAEKDLFDSLGIRIRSGKLRFVRKQIFDGFPELSAKVFTVNFVRRF